METPNTPQGPLGTEGPDLSPPCLEPQVSKTSKDANVELGECGGDLGGPPVRRRRRKRVILDCFLLFSAGNASPDRAATGAKR